MYRISVEGHYDAAHALRGYMGKCENLHGHRFKVVARIRTNELDDIGLAYDFRELRQKLNAVLERFDHVNVSEIPPFDRLNPSSENMARVIFEALAPELSGVTLDAVEVWESPESCAEYRED
jgi:6-pyruvoyltetrahydropterin/6-carboxytetrahydropterin synthase